MHVTCYAKWHENARCYKFGNYLYTCMWVYVWYVLCKVAWKNNGMNIMHYTLWHESKVNPCYVSSTCMWVYVGYVLCKVAWKDNGMNIMHYTLWHESKVNPYYVSSECKNVIYLKTMCMVPCMNENKMWM